MNEHDANEELTGPTRRTVTVEEAGHILGIGRAAAYRAASRGQIPTIRLGRRLLVPITALERLLATGDPQPVRDTA